MSELNHKKEFYTAKRLRVLKYLMDKGFKPCETIPDPTNPFYNWWQFKNTPELQVAVEEFFAQK